MSLARATFSGTVYREPQKRFTSNNVPITYFTFNIGIDEEELIRVRALGNLAERVEKEVLKDDRLVIEGNLTLPTIKTETGAEKKIVELGLSAFEKIADNSETSDFSTQAAKTSAEDTAEDIVKFNEAPDDLIGEDEIPF